MSFVCLSLPVCLYISVSLFMSTFLFVCLSVCLSVCLYVCLSVCPTICLSVCLSIRLSLRGFAVLDFLKILSCSRRRSVRNEARGGYTTYQSTHVLKICKCPPIILLFLVLLHFIGGEFSSVRLSNHACLYLASWGTQDLRGP